MRTQPTTPGNNLRPPASGNGRPASAHSREKDSRKAAAEIISQFDGQLRGASPTAVFVFLSAAHDGSVIMSSLRERYPSDSAAEDEDTQEEGSVLGNLVRKALQ